MKIQWKYTEKASLLQAGSVKYFQIRIPNYFTERARRGGYIYSISTVFPFIISRSEPAAAGISIVFPPHSLPYFRVPSKQSIAYHKLMRWVWDSVGFEHRPFVRVAKA